MTLRNQVEWALHCCSVLSGLPANEYIATKKLAEFHGVPKEYLSKALQALAQAKIIEGNLGPSGGYRLAKPAKQISFLDIVEAIEGKEDTFQCTEIRGNNPCLKKAEKKFTGVCTVAKIMYRADEAWRKELRAVTLADFGQELQTVVPAEHLQRGLDWLLTK